MFSDALTLIGKSYGLDTEQSLTLPLYEWNETEKDLQYRHDTLLGVYADYCYSVELHLNNLPPIQKISVSVNGYVCDIKNFRDGIIEFHESRIFLDSFGFAQVDFEFETENSEKLNCNTTYLPVLVIDSINNESVQRMVKTIYEKSPYYLFNNQQRSQDNRTLGKSPIQDLNGQIEVLGKIVTSYKENFRYFKTNAAFSLNRVENIKSYEKVKDISLRTLQYIAQHPEQLQKNFNSTGIRVGRANYFPQKALVTENENNYDIYENKIIIGFLFSVYQTVTILCKNIQEQIIQYTLPSTATTNGYTSSAIVILDIGKERLKKSQIKLQELRTQIENLYNCYRQIFPIEPILVQSVPMPSPIFREIKAYHIIYNLMIEWFMYGSYNFERENILLPLLRSHKIYEMYVLIQLCDFVIQESYIMEESKHFPYSNLDEKKCTQDLSIVPNTFYFVNKLSKKHLTIYYEPAIQGASHKGENNIGLYRNNSVSIRSTRTTARPYLPDYVIKVQSDDSEIYFILDAKFSRKNTVRTRYFPELAYKYLFSVSTINMQGQNGGLIVLNGKASADSEESDDIFNFYDHELDDNPISPMAKIFTLAERTEEAKEQHLRLFHSLLGKYI